MRPAGARRAEHAVGHGHVPARQLGSRSVAYEIALVDVVAAHGRVAYGVVDGVLVRRVADAIAVERLQTLGPTTRAVLCKIVRCHHVGVVLAVELPIATVYHVAQLAQRAKGAQRRVRVHGHGVCEEVLFAVHLLVQLPEVRRHGRALHGGQFTILPPETQHGGWVVVPRLGKVRLGEERRRHDEPVAVVLARIVIGVCKGADLGIVAPGARGGRVAHKLQEGLARGRWKGQSQCQRSGFGACGLGVWAPGTRSGSAP